MSYCTGEVAFFIASLAVQVSTTSMQYCAFFRVLGSCYSCLALTILFRISFSLCATECNRSRSLFILALSLLIGSVKRFDLCWASAVLDMTGLASLRSSMPYLCCLSFLLIYSIKLLLMVSFLSAESSRSSAPFQRLLIHGCLFICGRWPFKFESIIMSLQAQHVYLYPLTQF